MSLGARAALAPRSATIASPGLDVRPRRPLAVLGQLRIHTGARERLLDRGGRRVRSDPADDGRTRSGTSGRNRGVDGNAARANANRPVRDRFLQTAPAP